MLPSRAALARLAMLAVPLALAACATQMHGTVKPSAPGFLLGLVQGFIAPVSFIVSLFSPDIAVYAVPNNGAWYNFGFVLGIGGFAGGASQARR
ncbi:hypothetical protein [Sphingomonas crusticola]|uniref:hypothetical protein n=1 Tax=Sphingomonas crusticola TaxID=1697973 RepID=UPI000E24660C|nr:hypothetical protein [Sphingomonas crusticola]